MAEKGMEKVRAALDELQPGLAAKFNEDELSKLDIAGFHTAQDLKDAKEKDLGTLLRTARLANLRPFLSSSGDSSYSEFANSFNTLLPSLRVSARLAHRQMRFTSSNASYGDERRSNEPFKQALKAAYFPNLGASDHVACMVTGHPDCIAGHLIGHNQKEAAYEYLLYKEADMHSWRNGLFWNSFVELAYEDSRICFAWEPDHLTLRLYLLDENLRHTFCKDLTRHKTKAGGVPKVPGYGRPAVPSTSTASSWEGMTWGSLDGNLIRHTFSKVKHPFKRAIRFHQVEACSQARIRDCLPPAFDESKFDDADVSDDDGTLGIARKIQDYMEAVVLPTEWLEQRLVGT